MDLKKMLLSAAEAQSDMIKDEMIKHLASDEMAEKIASAINAKIDIPFVSEDKEQIFFEKIVDVVTDLLEGLMRGK
jgi:hypothetical protein|tara:strand:+ start:286 stop:513 length:228 start_codon:yes stop_codon:yes gene_type:complete